MQKHLSYVERSISDIAREVGKEPLDAFLDFALEEDLKTLFYFRSDVSTSAMAEVLADPFVLPGLSDGGAHVTRRCDSHFSTFLLSFWVREQQALSLEEAVRKLTFMGASAFGLHDRGLDQAWTWPAISPCSTRTASPRASSTRWRTTLGTPFACAVQAKALRTRL